MELSPQGEYARRLLPDGRTGIVFPLLFGRARLGVMGAGETHYLDWVQDQW